MNDTNTTPTNALPMHSKQDFRALLHTFLDPLLPLYSVGGARLRIGGAGATYGQEAIELEAFSRPLWGLFPFWAGGGQSADFAELYARGLAAGTDPQSPEYWGGFTDYDQRFVEMAAIACGLIFTPEVLWEPLTETQRAQTAKWLYGINEHFIPDCNWQFFRVLVNVALKRLGMPYSPEKLEESLQKAESYYLEDGWYQDGASCQKDYYIPFAMQYYGLVYAAVMEKEDPERSARFKERGMRFGQDFVYWFSENGAALPFGRSLTYRFAQVSFWCACLFAGVAPLPVAQMKGLIVRHMQYWLSQDLFDRDGVLTVGYAYPNLMMSERYNAPGSPYWSMKTFLLLALPDDHEFWQAEPAPLPPLAPIKALPAAAMLLHRHAGATAYAGGVCELYGHGHLVEKYSKFAYSTLFGVSMARSQFVLHEACPDSMLAFVPKGDDTVFVRKRSISYEISENGVVSVWSPLPGILVTTTITPTAKGHRRHHEIQSSLVCTAYDCGFSVEKFCAGYKEYTEEARPCAMVENSAMGCRVSGSGPKAAGYLVGPDPNTNLLWRNTNIPAVCYSIPVGTSVLDTEVEAWGAE